MKARLQQPLNRKTQKVIEDEMDKAFQKRLGKYNREANIMVMYALHEAYGFGETRLTKFFQIFTKLQQEVMDKYEMGYADLIFICEKKLRDDKIDIEKVLKFREGM